MHIRIVTERRDEDTHRREAVQHMAVPEQDDPDRELAEAFRTGKVSHSAIGALIGRVKRHIWNNHVGLRDEADDLAGRTVTIAYTRIDTFGERSRFFTWVIGIAEMLVKSRLAKAGLRPADVPLDDLPQGDKEWLASVARREQAEDEESMLVVWEIDAAVAKLGEPAKTIFELSVHEDMPSSDVALQVGETAENVRQILSRTCRGICTLLRASGWEHYRRPSPSVTEPQRTSTRKSAGRQSEGRR